MNTKQISAYALQKVGREGVKRNAKINRSVVIPARAGYCEVSLMI